MFGEGMSSDEFFFAAPIRKWQRNVKMNHEPFECAFFLWFQLFLNLTCAYFSTLGGSTTTVGIHSYLARGGPNPHALVGVGLLCNRFLGGRKNSSTNWGVAFFFLPQKIEEFLPTSRFFFSLLKLMTSWSVLIPHRGLISSGDESFDVKYVRLMTEQLKDIGIYS